MPRQPQGPPVAFRPNSRLQTHIAERQELDRSTGLIAARDLERYYELLRRSLPIFTEAEAFLIVDACNGWFIEPHSAPLLWAKVDECIRRNGVNGEQNPNGPALVARLRTLTPFEQLAIADAVERFWNGDHSNRAAGLRRVGLVKD